LESKVLADNYNLATACPAGALVGHASLVVNARPTVKPLISGTASLYNVIDDPGLSGYPKGSGVLVLDIHTSIGVHTQDFFHIAKKSGRVTLTVHNPQPAKPGIQPGDFTIQKLDLTINKPYLTAPSKCSGSWDFALTISSFFGGPTILAHDGVPCKK
jgi:hypothetical protein